LKTQRRIQTQKRKAGIMSTIRRQSLVVSLLLVVVWLVFASLVCGQEYLQPKGYVNDFANLLSASEIDSLSVELRDFQSKTSIEIAVVTVTSLQGLTVEDYTNGLANAWGVGKKGKDNGVVLLLAPTEKKVRIEVGRGLEEVLTDLHSSRIIREDIKPLYRQHPNQAIIAGTHGIMRRLVAGQEKPINTSTSPASTENNEATREVLLFLGIFAVIVVIVVLFNYFSERNEIKKQNASALEVCRQALLTIKQGHKLAFDQLNQLKLDNPQSVWQELQEQLAQVEVAALERELSDCEQECLADRKKREAAWQHMQRLQMKLASCARLFKNIEATLAEISEAKALVPQKLASIPADIQLAVVAVQQADVTADTRAKLAEEQQEFQHVQQLLVVQSSAINWLEVMDLLSQVEVGLVAVMVAVEEDKATATKARADGPQLLQELPATLLAAEGRAGTSRSARTRLAKAKSEYHRARSLVNAGSDVDWVAVYLLLLAASDLCSSERATSVASPSYHSSDDDHGHSDSGSSVSFTSFGGGSFGGGGASGDL
jgi:uncharacterized protein